MYLCTCNSPLSFEGFWKSLLYLLFYYFIILCLFFLPACHSDQDNFKFNHSHNNVFQNDFHAKSKSNCTDVQMLNPLGSETWTMSQEIAFADLQSVCIKGSLCHSIMLLLSSQIAIHQPEIVWLWSSRQEPTSCFLSKSTLMTSKHSTWNSPSVLRVPR